MSWKKALLVALVVLLVLIGVPLLMQGMGTTFCHECGPVVAASTACGLAAVLTGVVLLVGLIGLWLRSRRDVLRELLLVVAFDRPPRLV